jgi:hypothetical protein
MRLVHIGPDTRILPRCQVLSSAMLRPNRSSFLSSRNRVIRLKISLLCYIQPHFPLELLIFANSFHKLPNFPAVRFCHKPLTSPILDRLSQMIHHDTVNGNMDQIYLSIHETQPGSSLVDLSWRLMVQTRKPSRIFHHSKKPEPIIYESGEGAIAGRSFTQEDQATQILKVLISETQSADLASRIQTAFSPLNGKASIQHELQRLQQNKIIPKFDLHIFTTIVEDRLRLIMRSPRTGGVEIMNYLSYCQTPAARSPAGSEGSDYFMSTYGEPVKKTKKGFWITHGSGQPYRSAMSNDPYGGLM